MNRYNLRYILLLVVAMPSVVVGAIAMKFYGVPHTIIVQNLAFLLIACFVSYFAVFVKHKTNKRNSLGVFILISLLAYILAYVDGAIGGVHRWISIGPIRLYISSIVLPMLIIQLWSLLSIKREMSAVVIALIVSILLFLQPDASQITAFVIPMVILIIKKIDSSILRYIFVTMLVTLVIGSWIFLDNLPAVSYVEDIVIIVSEMGLIWYIFGIASLAMLPLPFILLPPEGYKLVSRCVGLYYIIVLISTKFGNFPVPLMGYGVSPIIGYYAAITWLIKHKADLWN